jgi:serine/threonine protein kinase
MGDPAQAQEAEALTKVRELLPDDGIARAWANISFTDNGGRLNEVDVLALTRAGLWLIELKGWHGEINGDQQTWFHANHVENNPRKLANLKAKRLASVLKDVAWSAHVPTKIVPFVSEAVVLHGRDSVVHLDQFGAESVWALDGFKVKGLGPERLLSNLFAVPSKNQPIDAAQAKAIDHLMDAAGLMPRAKQRMIGQYALDAGEPLGEGPGWQDFLVTHPQAKTKRRIRLFPYPKGASKDVRDGVDMRAAREFRLTDGIVHPGIIGPAELLNPEEGPALVFPYDPDEISLATYLEENAAELTFEDRERLVQDLAELVRFAHGQRLTHRALSPLSVRVHTSVAGPVTVRVRDWDLARRPESGTATTTVISRGLTDIVQAVDADMLLYLAPETLRGATPASAQTLDIYGVGSVAHLILTGKPPASNLAALEQLVASGTKGLDPRAVMPEISDTFADVIVEATAFIETFRLVDISDFQARFELARSMEREDEPAPTAVDPLEAGVGDIVGERFEIVSRRGSGSTGVALDVTDYENATEGVILKLAKDDSAAARLAVEADVLKRLDHPRVVKYLDGPLEVGIRRGLLMTDAGKETLADRIRLEGRATIEQLERYGADLFDAVAYLESQGVFHRDIKPSNLAVKPDPGNRRPRLTLFDFSLAEEPLTNVRSGSRPYLDPYLGAGRRSQYDSAAERFAIAATLFELATANPVWWEQGDAPSSATDAAIVRSEMFDQGVAEGLVRFFRTALAPRSEERHPSLAAMQDAWKTALAAASADFVDVEANDAKAAAAELSTPLPEAGLSARALSALSRVKAGTVGELLGVPPMSINQIRGLGEQVRREISARIREWRHRLTSTETQTNVEVPAGRRSVESFIGTVSVKPGETSEDRYKRLRKSGTLKRPTDDLARWVAELGNVATLDELAAKLLREYGSTLSDAQQRMDAATAVARTILELDGRSRDPLFVIQIGKAEARHAVAYAPDSEDGLTFDEAEQHLETLLQFGGTVDELLENADVVPAARLRETLMSSGAADLRISESRVLQLAIGLSTRGKVSSMGEAYRADLSGSRAVELALRGAATRELAVITIEQRVRARFPEVSSIPSRPALDASVKVAMPYLEWNGDLGKYAVRSVELASMTYTAASTTWGRPASDPLIAARLAASVRESTALVLVASRRYPLAATARVLAREHKARIVDLADLALEALKSTAQERRVDWRVVLRADGQPADSHDRKNLLRLARAAITPRWEDMLADEQPTILLNAAILARFDLVDFISKVTDLATPRPAARWFLLPRPTASGTPDLDGVPFPFGADRWIELSLDSLLLADSTAATSQPTPSGKATLQ